MFRRLVAIYMTFVLAAGPSLCCCTTVYAASSSAARPAPSPPDRTPPCCGKHAHSEKVAAASCHSSEQSDEPQPGPKPGKHQCPCKDNGGKPTPDTTSPEASAAVDAIRLLTADLQYTVAFTADLLADFGFDPTGGQSPPGQRLTSWRLLNAPHMLRC